MLTLHLPLNLTTRVDEVPLYCIVSEQGQEPTLLYNLTTRIPDLPRPSLLRPISSVICNFQDQELDADKFFTYIIYQGDIALTTPSPAQQVLQFPLSESPQWLDTSNFRLFDGIFRICETTACMCIFRHPEISSAKTFRVNNRGDCSISAITTLRNSSVELLEDVQVGVFPQALVESGIPEKAWESTGLKITFHLKNPTISNSTAAVRLTASGGFEEPLSLEISSAGIFGCEFQLTELRPVWLPGVYENSACDFVGDIPPEAHKISVRVSGTNRKSNILTLPLLRPVDSGEVDPPTSPPSVEGISGSILGYSPRFLGLKTPGVPVVLNVSLTGTLESEILCRWGASETNSGVLGVCGGGTRKQKLRWCEISCPQPVSGLQGLTSVTGNLLARIPLRVRSIAGEAVVSGYPEPTALTTVCSRSSLLKNWGEVVVVSLAPELAEISEVSVRVGSGGAAAACSAFSGERFPSFGCPVAISEATNLEISFSGAFHSVCPLAAITEPEFDGSAVVLAKTAIPSDAPIGTSSAFLLALVPETASASCRFPDAAAAARTAVQTTRGQEGVVCAISVRPLGRRKKRSDASVLEARLVVLDGIEAVRGEAELIFYAYGVYGEAVEVGAAGAASVLVAGGEVLLKNDGIFADASLRVKCRFGEDEVAERRSGEGVFVCAAPEEAGRRRLVVLVEPEYEGERVVVETVVYNGEFEVVELPVIADFEPKLVITSEPRVNVTIRLKFPDFLEGAGEAADPVYCELDGVRTGRAKWLNKTTISCDLHDWNIDGFVAVQVNVAGLTLTADPAALEVRDRRVVVVEPPQPPVVPPTEAFGGFPEFDLRKVVLLEDFEEFPRGISDTSVEISILGIWPAWPAKLSCVLFDDANIEVAAVPLTRRGEVSGTCDIDATSSAVSLVIKDEAEQALSKALRFRSDASVSEAAFVLEVTPKAVLFAGQDARIRTVNDSRIVGCSFGESGAFQLRKPGSGSQLTCEVPDGTSAVGEEVPVFLHWETPDFRFNTGATVNITARPVITRVLQTQEWELELAGDFSALWSRSVSISCVVGGIQTPATLVSAAKARCDLSHRRWLPGKHHIHVAYSDGFSTSLVRSVAWVTIAEPPGLPGREFTRLESINSTYTPPPPSAKPKKPRLPTLPLEKPN